MPRDTFGKITVYRLDSGATQSLNAFDNFVLVKEDVFTVGTSSIQYRLFFLEQSDSKQASWYRGFRPILGTAPHTIPVISLPGFILIVELGASSYAVTGGLGFAPIRKCVIEGHFGLTLARKLIFEAELKGLSQKDTGGSVNYLDRAFRRGYSPAGDTGNLKRILTHLRATLSDQNPYYQQIGKSITAGDALTVNGQKSFAELMQFIVAVDELWSAELPLISIPQLEEINKKRDASLIETLNNALVQTLLRYDPTKHDFFIDNDDAGYLPDRVISYQFTQTVGAPVAHPSTEDLFSEIRQTLNGLPDLVMQRKFLDEEMLRLTFDDGHFEDVNVKKYLCGDINIQNEVYFINNGSWYHASQNYIELVNRELDQIPCMTPEDLGLSEWDLTQYPIEPLYNKAQLNCTCLDTYLVRVPQERGGIEFCDLLKEHDNEFLFIHVKKASGAQLRALFSQGAVSATYFAYSPDFQNAVFSGILDKMPYPVPETTLAALNGLRDVERFRIRIVYAIFDDTPSHVPVANSNKTSQVLQGTLSAFSKVDLLTRVEQLASLRYQVAVLRIRPYPT